MEDGVSMMESGLDSAFCTDSVFCTDDYCDYEVSCTLAVYTCNLYLRFYTEISSYNFE